MVTLDQIINKLKPELPDLVERYKIESLSIFGSYVRNEQTENSDLDLLIELDDSISLFDYSGLHLELEEMLGLKVDLIEKCGYRFDINELVVKKVV